MKMSNLIETTALVVLLTGLAQSVFADEKAPTAEISSFTWETNGRCSAKCDSDEKRPVSKPVTKEVIVSGEGGTTI